MILLIELTPVCIILYVSVQLSLSLSSPQSLSKSLNQKEEAKRLLATAKTMLEALQQTIDLLKDTQLSESEISPPASVEATPPPLGACETNRGIPSEVSNHFYSNVHTIHT